MKKVISTILVVMILLSAMVFTASAASSESESNDTYSTADTFSLNSTISGKLSSTSDIDFYKITASANGKLTISFNHTYTTESLVRWDVWVYYFSDGALKELSYKLIQGSDSEKIEFPVVGAVSSGAYYVKVSTLGYYGDNACNRSYSIKNSFSSTEYFEKEFNDSYATANTMSTGKEYSGCLNNSNDYDYYKIVAPYDGKLSLTFNHPYNSNAYWSISIFYYSDGTYNELSHKNIHGTDSDKFDFPAIGTVKSGIYYIQITSIAYSFGSTASSVYSIKNSFSSTAYYEKEMNNSYSTATTVSLNKAYSGHLNCVGDQDFYKLTLSSNATITLNFNHVYVDNSNVDWCINVYKYSGGTYTEVASKYVYGNSSEIFAVINSQSFAAGIYYVKISTSSLSAASTVDETCKNEYSIKFISSSTSTTSYTLSYDANGGSGAPEDQTGGTTYIISSVEPQRPGYTFLGWSKYSNTYNAKFKAGDEITISKNTTLYAVWKENPTTSSDGLIIKTKRVVLDTQEYTMGASTITIDEKYLSSSYTIVATASDDTIINLGASESSYANSAVIDIYAKKVGECTVTVKVMNKAKTVTYEEGTIEVVVRDTYRKTFYAGYKSSYYFEDYFFDGVEIVDAWSNNENVVSVEENRYMYTGGLGATTVYAVDADGNMQEFHFDVDYDFFDWLIIILLFGWIWYI